jgi:hypothetical protein
MTGDDADLKAQFEALKAQDARAVQPFATCWEAARLSEKRRERRLGVPAAAAALTLLLAVAIALYFRPAPDRTIDNISRWQSPTASLLKTPGSELFTNMPRIGEPVIPPVKDEIQ